MNENGSEGGYVVVKVGSNVVTRAVEDKDRKTRIDRNVMENVAQDISRVMQELGHKVILVSSGAVAAGREHIVMPDGIDSITKKQALAAVGQPVLMNEWARFFATAHPSRLTSQHLVTWSDFDSVTRSGNISRTFHALPDSVVPIVNENDPVATEELKLGDNDQLAAHIAKLMKAQFLVLLTDVDGVYDKNPNEDGAKLIETIDVSTLTPEFIQSLGIGTSTNGTGGMASKLSAAKKASEAGITTYIANGKKTGTLTTIAAGGKTGTRFEGAKRTEA